MLIRGDFEVKHFLLDAELLVQRDGRIISIVSLHEDHVDTSFRGQPLELLYHARGHTASAIGLFDRQVIDVELRPCLLELWQYVSCHATDHGCSCESRYGNEGLAFQQALELRIVRLVGRIGYGVAECSAKHDEHAAQDGCLLWTKSTDL